MVFIMSKEGLEKSSRDYHFFVQNHQQSERQFLGEPMEQWVGAALVSYAKDSLDKEIHDVKDLQVLNNAESGVLYYEDLLKYAKRRNIGSICIIYRPADEEIDFEFYPQKTKH